MRAMILTIVTACGLATACGAEDGPFLVPDGQFVLDWTIANTTEPNLCDANGAITIDVIVTTPNGEFVGEFQQGCAAFATSINLPPGAYAASAALLDPSGAARTTQVDIAPFRLRGADQIIIPVNFPPSSFF